jgi:hypothetical protein
MFDELSKMKMTIVLSASLLFFLLSPGVILTLPKTNMNTATATPTSTGTCSARNDDIWFQLSKSDGTCTATNWCAVITHTFIFGLVLYLLLEMAIQNRMNSGLLGGIRGGLRNMVC